MDRLYGARFKGGRGLISAWDAFRSSIIRILHTIENSDNDILQICCKLDRQKMLSNVKQAKKYEVEVTFDLLKGVDEKPILHQAKIKAAIAKSGYIEHRIKKWVEKPQHGAYMRQLIEGGANVKESFAWLNRCFLDPFTESYILAAQEMALFTKHHEKYILKTHADATCRICRKQDTDETIYHILSGCDALAKREYFTRHNAVCKYIHFVLCGRYKLPCGQNWYMHQPKDVIINQDVEILYDQILTTDMAVGANRPDLVVKDKRLKKTFLIDVSWPCDTNIHKMEATKIAMYIGLKGQLQKMWGFDCITVPIIIGGLGAVTFKLKDYLALIPGCPSITMCQKITLLGSKQILKDVLSRSR